MNTSHGVSRRRFLQTTGAAAGLAAMGRWSPPRLLASQASTPHADMAALRRSVVTTPVRVGLERARIFTKVFQASEGQPWIVRKALALRAYLETVPLYIRPHDRIAGSISERPERQSYLKGQVPEEIRDYWKNRNLWGRYRTEILGRAPVRSHDELPEVCPNYKFISNQGHLCPSYKELLAVGVGGLRRNIQARRQHASDAEQLAFLTAADHALAGLAAWAGRYAEFLRDESRRCDHAGRAAELAEMARICGRVALQPPETFREALQLVWLAHQAIHVEGHGYSCTPDRLDQLLLPLYEADRKAGRLDDAEAVRLVENFVLKMYDNSYWGSEHHLTQGFVVGGSTPDGRDLTNRLSWLMIEGATNMALPEPLVWMRWHPAVDQQFFDFCLTRLRRTTCFPMLWNDTVVAAGLRGLGVADADAMNYVPVGCNELGIPGQFYFNPGAWVGYLQAVEAALSDGRGYKKQWKWKGVAPPVGQLESFDQFAAAVGAYMRAEIRKSYDSSMQELQAQMRWGQTPLTSCFFEGCVEKARDLTQGTKYNILSCGGTAFANAVDCLGAVRQVVYEKHQATLAEVAAACAANFQGYERLRAKLRAAPKQGNDDPRLDDVIRLVERLRDEPMREICREPRGGRFGNSHVVRSSAVTMGRATPATPDGRLAGTPVANSVAVSAGCELNGPTATLNSVCKLDAAKSWQCAYQVNIRFHAGMVADDARREKLRAMLNVYFRQGGQELQINVVDSAAMRAAQKNPEEYRDLVVRVAGFSEFFVNLTPEMQNEIIARTEHM